MIATMARITEKKSSIEEIISLALLSGRNNGSDTDRWERLQYIYEDWFLYFLNHPTIDEIFPVISRDHSDRMENQA